MSKQRVIVTGAAGFIGFHLCKKLLEKQMIVYGVDCLTDYYDVALKESRLKILHDYQNFIYSSHNIYSESDDFSDSAKEFNPEIIFHLAAQAGVRHSIKNPDAYLQNNIIATFNILELSREINLSHLIIASTSSVYGSNTELPFKEDQRTDSQMSFYAASKKSCEVMAHSYSHIYEIPITVSRFFTVYGPWGRPDMALFKFTKRMLEGRPIDIFNNGEMYRDFTYVSDVSESLSRLAVYPPTLEKEELLNGESPVAAYRILNIGNSNSVPLMDYVRALEECLGVEAKINFKGMQQGDVPSTYSDSKSLEDLIGFRPDTSIKEGVASFVEWYLKHYQHKVNS